VEETTPVAVARGLQLRVLQRGLVVVQNPASMEVSCRIARIRRVSGGAHSADSAVRRQGLMCATYALPRLRLLILRCSTLSCLVQKVAWLMIRHRNLVHWVDEKRVKIPGRFCPHWDERTSCLTPDRAAQLRALRSTLETVRHLCHYASMDQPRMEATQLLTQEQKE
jgi:hypothetical protein